MKQKKIYISWHCTSHGIGYMKQTLAAYYMDEISPNKSQPLSQQKMEKAFDVQKKGKTFDTVYYLVVKDSVFDEISSRKNKMDLVGKDKPIISDADEKIWKSVYDQKLSIDEEIFWLKSKYPKDWKRLSEQIWRRIHYYPVIDQIEWFKKYSNVKSIYGDKLIVQKFDNIKSLHVYQEIGNALSEWFSNLDQKSEYYINIWQGTKETQAVWFSLRENNFLPANIKFLTSYDKKSSHSHKFKDFYVHEIPPDIFNKISFRFSNKPLSGLRKIVEDKTKAYLKAGFAILILGERGTGKTKLIEENKEQPRFVAVNCASFADDIMAEAELFGYVGGAFTGGLKGGAEGLFKAAEGGILFFDEIYHLSKRVQGKLMKALQTDQNNQFSYRKLGDTKLTKTFFTVVFASNLSIQELQKNLLPDFYDRVAQLVIELPPLRETKEELTDDWQRIWTNLQFQQECPKEKKLLNWLRQQDFPGNFRDLQKIAIYYHTFQNFSEELKMQLEEKFAFEFAKKQFEKYHTRALETKLKYNFNRDKTTEHMIKEYKSALAKWAKKTFGSAQKAEDHFKALGDEKGSARSLNNWIKEEPR